MDLPADLKQFIIKYGFVECDKLLRSVNGTLIEVVAVCDNPLNYQYQGNCFDDPHPFYITRSINREFFLVATPIEALASNVRIIGWWYTHHRGSRLKWDEYMEQLQSIQNQLTLDVSEASGIIDI